MGWSLIDHFRTFHSLSKEYDLSAGARSVYFALLGEFNAAYWPDELRISDRQMQELSGVKSVATVHDARNLLKSLKLIDFRKGKNRKTIYRLLTDRIANTIQTPIAELSEHQPNTCQTLDERTGLFPIPACAREDLKTGKTERPSATAPRGRDSLRRVRVELGEGATTAAEPAAQTAAGRQTCGKDANDGGAYAPLHERTLPLRSPENEEGGFDAFIDDWSDSPVFCKLDFELISELKVLSEKYGLAALRQAMTAAKRANGKSQGVSFDFFKAVLERQQKPDTQPLKGGEKSGKREHQYAKPPEYDFLDEWEQRKAANPVE